LGRLCLLIIQSQLDGGILLIATSGKFINLSGTKNLTVIGVIGVKSQQQHPHYSPNPVTTLTSSCGSSAPHHPTPPSRLIFLPPSALLVLSSTSTKLVSQLQPGTLRTVSPAQLKNPANTPQRTSTLGKVLKVLGQETHIGLFISLSRRLRNVSLMAAFQLEKRPSLLY
jgi:hypothetical protein